MDMDIIVRNTKSTKSTAQSQNLTTLFFAQKKSSTGTKTVKKFKGLMIISKEILGGKVKIRQLKIKARKGGNR